MQVKKRSLEGWGQGKRIHIFFFVWVPRFAFPDFSFFFFFSFLFLEYLAVFFPFFPFSSAASGKVVSLLLSLSCVPSLQLTCSFLWAGGLPQCTATRGGPLQIPASYFSCLVLMDTEAGLAHSSSPLCACPCDRLWAVYCSPSNIRTCKKEWGDILSYP